MCGIETLKKLKTEKIVEAIKNKEVADEIIDIIAFAKKQPTRKFYNPKIYKAILSTMPEEDIAINILEKLIAKNKADIEAFTFFFTNKNIDKKVFNAYLEFAVSIIGDDVLKVIDQADPRVEERFLSLIIEKRLEKADILLNKNISRENFVKVAKKHIKELAYQCNMGKFDLNKYDASLAIELAKNCDDYELLKNTSITKEQMKELITIIDDGIFFIRALTNKYFSSDVAEVIFDKVKKEISERTLVEIIYNYPNLLEKAGFKNMDELFKSVKDKNKDIFMYYPIQISRELQKELLEEFKNQAKNKTFRDVYKRFSYLEHIGTYLAKAGDLDIAREVVKINDKLFERVNLVYLSRDDVVIKKADIKDFLSNETKILNKIIIVDGEELFYEYDNEFILNILIKKADKVNKKFLLSI